MVDLVPERRMPTYSIFFLVLAGGLLWMLAELLA
jgi:hypothetical protein